MDSATPHIPAPSVAWSRLATSPIDDLAAQVSVVPVPPAPLRREDDADHLRARLLRMIVDNEHTRKAAATEAYNAR